MEKLDTTKKGTECTIEAIRCFNNFMPTDFLEENQKFIDWLKVQGFFNIPAAVHHHSNCTSGLFNHSFIVAQTLVDYTKALGLKWSRPWSPYIVGMFHDLCKLEAYSYNFDYSEWEYSADQGVIPGHGEKSVIMLQQHIQLTEEEIACIRWHMGAFESKEMWSGYSSACKKVPNVLYTHTADMYASQVLGI